MKIRLFIFLGFILFRMPVPSQTFSVPYELAGDKMKVQVEVGGSAEWFIFDTGAPTTVTYELALELGLGLGGQVRVTDASSARTSLQKTTLDRIMFKGSNASLKNIPALIMGKGDNPFACYGCRGLIGNDVFNRFILEIDSRKKEITFLEPVTVLNISLRNMVKFEANASNMPIIKIGLVEGETIRCLFDTGSGPFLSLRTDDATDMIGKQAMELVCTGESFGGKGIAGAVQQAKKMRVEVPLITIGPYKFTNLRTEDGNPPFNLLGTALLDYGKVTIDYSKSRFYFEPFEPFEPKAASLQKPSWSIGFTVVDNALVVASVWGDEDRVGVGDRVIEIDGEAVGQLDFCDAVINGLTLLKNKEHAVVKIKHGDETRDIAIKKQ